MPKVGANILYDLEWLKCDPRLRIDVAGPKYDVQVAEPLLDENLPTYSLDSLGVRHVGRHKDETELVRAAVELLGVGGELTQQTHLDLPGVRYQATDELMKRVKANLWRLPGHHVGAYGEADAVLTLDVFAKQEVLLRRDDLWRLFHDVETPLVDLLLQMRLRGVPVNLAHAEAVAAEMEARLAKVRAQLHRRVGFEPDIWSAEDLVKGCEKLGVTPPVTVKGHPSFEASFLDESDCEFLNLVGQARKLDRAGGVFIRRKIIKLAVAGRVHPQFFQVRSDRGGTTSGRFASANPNAQNFPARDEELARLVRGCFVPEPGKTWYVFDHSQQEPRTTVHYAYLASQLASCRGVYNFGGAVEARERYLRDPNTDYHKMTAEMASITRKQAKPINLGLTYGMGKDKLARQLGLTRAEAEVIFRAYHGALPFVRGLGYFCQDLVKRRGYIVTALGRRRHFNRWGPTTWSPGVVPLPKEEAVKKWGSVQLYFLHKVLNALIQGTCADMIKKNLLDVWRGLGHVPYLTVHDENDYGLGDPEEARKVRQIMLESLPLTVPLKVDVEAGPSWGEVVDLKW